MKTLSIITLIMCSIGLVLLYGLYSDMAHQRDVALATVSWCKHDTETERCKESDTTWKPTRSWTWLLSDWGMDNFFE